MNIVMIRTREIHPHPLNPRVDLGDLTELADSIRENGIRQNLTVVPGHSMTDEEWKAVAQEYAGNPTEELRTQMNYRYLDTEYTVIIGHRRLAAAKLAGLTELPCVVADLDAKEQQATMIMENMQRNDLTVYEQARGFQLMLSLGATVDEISKKTGFSKETVRKRVKLTELNQKILKEVSDRQITLSDLESLSDIEDPEARDRCLEQIGTNNFTADVYNEKRKQKIQKALPEIKKILAESGLKALEKNDQYSQKYDKDYGRTIRLEGYQPGTNILPKDESLRFYYLDEHFGHLDFYKKHQKAEPVRKTKEELEKEKSIAEAWKLAEELLATTRQLREDFMKKVSMTARNNLIMMRMLIYGMTASSVGYCSLREAVERVLWEGEEKAPTYTERIGKAMKRVDMMSTGEFARMAYASFCDNLDHDTKYIGGTKQCWPMYHKSEILDKLYECMKAMGYEMSDLEKQLQDGTHPVFKEPETGRKGEEKCS